ncbi:phage tail protein [Pseudomonas chlororaphis]|uniref:Phage tail protein n=1 Tax=Pseudomonas chlororaphis TaxID=587753 RepID=A0AAP9VX62_9PSED|nr:phage tail protein [Pseudomonas chlororaphis]AUG39477.1 phage tail protein [Pseudomonas chlororaphis]QNR49072.1 phage tail protein [Pseudomonas chlororaphis]
MDYPKSVPSVGLVNGRFVDEDPLAGTPGSLIPASWGNSVTQEILGVVQAAGMTPDEGANDQLLGALRSPTLFSTPPRFDVSRSVATPEFVQRALGNYSSARGISESTQLTIADVGCSIGLGGTTAFTVTLPDVSTVPDGATISLHCRSSAQVTVASKSGAQISPQGNYLNSIVMSSGESANLVREWGVWTVYGTASLKYSALYGAQLSTAGYQKYPSGLIEQWVLGGSDANGVMSLSLPIKFPNAILGGIADEGYPSGWGGANVTVWSFDLNASNTSTAVARVRSVEVGTIRVAAGITGRIVVWGR